MLISGYHAIGLPLPHSSFRRFIYAKKHEAKKDKPENVNGSSESILVPGRTVYLVNLPSIASNMWLRACLEPLGTIQDIIVKSLEQLHEENDNSNDLGNRWTAHVVFKSKESVDKLLQIDVLETPVAIKTCGLQAYTSKYHQNRSGFSEIKEIADRYMASFDEMEMTDLRRREELKNQVDEDGFQVVVNTKKRGFIQSETLTARPAKKEKNKKVENFYRFQTREKKRDQLKTLRERFEEDRQIVEKMKKANKFIPE
ncbi:rRNA processing protein RRP7 [Plasmopara halstedii]|uniref:rRNA processing protein RRP7 n=1 Tax=Plasmopara halstedii TaxID=4781 RepID=A0A0P1B3Z2_PLAHL|nr:rRNA processing protein RRP7 [Plasmopara halstedii]CEG49487.1 rRNA processing protein RRP7 [Plasmopara halstedii]|eukprot:XP_024585856.1 rRNA processing protein RRP7 [Plasmopara halstedii]